MSNPDIVALYSTSQAGGELPYFAGKQYGSGWLQTIGRFALPILRRIGAIGMKTAQDVISNGVKILPTLKSNAVSEFKDFMDTDVPNMMSKKKKTEENLNGNGLKRKSINNQLKEVGTIFAKN